MTVRIKFITSMMKNGQLRKEGDIMEIDATTAILLANRNNVEILDYDIVQTEKTILVDELVPKNKI